MKALPLLALVLLATPAFADDVGVPVKPLGKATTVNSNGVVGLVCTVQSDASLNHCQVDEGYSTSAQDSVTAIGLINGKGNVAGHVVAGSPVHLVVSLGFYRQRTTSLLVVH